jgi:hypothetical protein
MFDLYTDPGKTRGRYKPMNGVGYTGRAFRFYKRFVESHDLSEYVQFMIDVDRRLVGFRVASKGAPASYKTHRLPKGGACVNIARLTKIMASYGYEEGSDIMPLYSDGVWFLPHPTPKGEQ